MSANAFETMVTNKARTVLHDLPAHIEWHGGSMFVHTLYQTEAVNLCEALENAFGKIRMGQLGETGEFYFDFV